MTDQPDHTADVVRRVIEETALRWLEEIERAIDILDSAQRMRSRRCVELTKEAGFAE